MLEALRIAVFDQAPVGLGWSLLLAPLRVKLVLFCHLHLLRVFGLSLSPTSFLRGLNV
jgi:hypothetical protein